MAAAGPVYPGRCAGGPGLNYHCDSEGTRLNYEVVGQAVAAVRCSAPLDEHWKDAIEEDFHKRQKKGRK